MDESILVYKLISQILNAERPPDSGAAFSSGESIGGEGGGRTHTLSEQRQILSLVRLPVPPLRLGTFQQSSIRRKALPMDLICRDFQPVVSVS